MWCQEFKSLLVATSTEKLKMTSVWVIGKLLFNLLELR